MTNKNKGTEEFIMEDRILAESVLLYRTKLEESQETFAENCNMSTDMLSLIERGKTNPSLHTMARIARHIGIALWEMMKPMDEKEEKKKSK